MTVLIDVISYGVVILVLPYFAQSLGAGPTTTSLLFSSFAFFSFLSSPFFGALSDRTGQFRQSIPRPTLPSIRLRSRKPF